ncbi:IS21 family transposase [Echinicola soli]|uniref:IS21 family transposase n=2 Tax=Echinicola soli TaxID=2591634 RepID=A0A514CEL6_9BACT|nr:IS21 family transposase [Echinicola soli]
MAGKPKPMSQIKQLIILNKQGKGIKTIARMLGMSKNTVKAYLVKLEKLLGQTGTSLTIDDLLALEEPEIHSRFHPGNPSYKDPRYDHFKMRLEYFRKELKRTGVTRALLWEEYRQSHPDGYSYSQFCHHLDQHDLARSKPTMVLDHQPGEKLYIDFAGKTIDYIDRETGEVISCQFFVACLPCSDYAFAMAVPSQRIADFLHALACCLEHLGGVPSLLVPDNLKSAVNKADKYEPDINRALEDFANHYGTAVLPARVRKPQDKALVENQVNMLYSRVYAKLRNMQFFDLYALNQAIKMRIRAHNQTRMQRKPYCREEKFLADEKPLLGKLPEDRFELRYHALLTVAKNNHVYLARDKQYYSVPYTLIGKKVKVVYTRSMFYVYHEGKKVAVHARSTKGGYSTVEDHLCSQHGHYRDRSPEYYRELARKKSAVLYQYVSLLFEQNRYPEQLYRTCDGLLALSRKSDPDTFDRACKIAMDHQVYSYGFIRNILENNMAHEQPDTTQKALPKHDNVRGKEYYDQQKLQF